jgi:Tol biopolymer transport system component
MLHGCAACKDVEDTPETPETPEVEVKDSDEPEVPGTVERVSLTTGGGQANVAGYENGYSLVQGSVGCAISEDGRYVAFVSHASNLVEGDDNELPDVFVRDREEGSTSRVSLTSAGAQGTGSNAYVPEWPVAISDDGLFVAFSTYQALSDTDTDALLDVYIRDIDGGVTTLASYPSAEGGAWRPSLSSDGAALVFDADAHDLVEPDLHLGYDAYLYQRDTSTLSCLSACEEEQTALRNSLRVSVSGDGAWACFSTQARLVSRDDDHVSHSIRFR